jgi:hypothetical protein
MDAIARRSRSAFAAKPVRVGVQHRLAAHFRRLADQAKDRTNLDAWAAFVDALPDDNEHVLAIARAQAEIGHPAQFTPRCDRGLHVRLMATRSAPTEHLLRYIASLEGRPEPWVYGDWAKQGAPPQRDGVPQWTVDVDVMVRGDGWEWPPEVEHPDAEQITNYGWGEVPPTYEENHLHARLKMWVPNERAALELSQQLVGEHFTRPNVIAHRVRAQPTPGEWEDKPRKPSNLTGGVYPVRWQRAEVEGTALTIAWRQRGRAFEHISTDEQPNQVTITVHERFGPNWTEDGRRIAFGGPDVFNVRTAPVPLTRPLGNRLLLDGATGRSPADLSIWDYREKQDRDQILRARLPRR